MNVDAFKFLTPRLWPDLFEILLVSFVIYRFLLFLVGTRALQIVIGLVILSLTYFVAVFAKFRPICERPPQSAQRASSAGSLWL